MLTLEIGRGAHPLVILDLVSDRRERRVSGIHSGTLMIMEQSSARLPVGKQPSQSLPLENGGRDRIIQFA